MGEVKPPQPICEQERGAIKIVIYEKRIEVLSTLDDTTDTAKYLNRALTVALERISPTKPPSLISVPSGRLPQNGRP